MQSLAKVFQLFQSKFEVKIQDHNSELKSETKNVDADDFEDQDTKDEDLIDNNDDDIEDKDPLVEVETIFYERKKGGRPRKNDEKDGTDQHMSIVVEDEG